MYEWDEEPEKDVYHSVKDYEFTFWINDNVDYNIHYDITIFMDGTRQIERVGEFMTLLDDEGNIVDSLEVMALPEKYRKDAERMAEEYDYV